MLQVRFYKVLKNVSIVKKFVVHQKKKKKKNRLRRFNKNDM